jgi:hypothetical protein
MGVSSITPPDSNLNTLQGVAVALKETYSVLPETEVRPRRDIEVKTLGHTHNQVRQSPMSVLMEVDGAYSNAVIFKGSTW